MVKRVNKAGNRQVAKGNKAMVKGTGKAVAEGHTLRRLQ